MKTIAIIGGGNMGEALIKGLHRTHRLFVCETNTGRVSYLKKKYRLKIVDISTAVQASSVVILALKPQDMSDLCKNIAQNAVSGKLFISIAAGLTTKFFEKYLGKARIIRCMPNMPALIGEGITAVCAGKYATDTDVKWAERILKAIGDTVVVKESMINAVTAVSGSGPAYVFLFVEQWMVAAKKLGFKDAEAKSLVYKTLLGSAHLLEKSEFDASTLRVKVTSKGGTTQAAMDVFGKRKFDQLMKEALLAANNRAKELVT